MTHQDKWHDSLWRDTSPAQKANAPLDTDIQADVVIVGGGFSGLRAATVLAEAGKSVAVLEAQDIGYGASGRSGGQVNPMLPFNSPKQIKKLVGTNRFRRLAQVSLNSADELFDLVRTYQIRCDARQHGWLRVLHSRKAINAAAVDCENWNEIGGEMKLIGADEVAKVSGSTRYSAGVVTARGGAIHPLKLVTGLAEVAAKLGVQIFGGSPVDKVGKHGGKWRVDTPAGSVTSDWVIVATNGYTERLVPGLKQSIIPMNPIQIATEPLPDDVYDSILPGGETISDSRRVIMYARREPENRIVYGGLGRLRNGALVGYDWLQRDAVRVFPQLAGFKWTNKWGGRIALTADHLPHIYEPQENLLVGLGYNGRGVAMSFVVGRAIAEHILGQQESDLPLPLSKIKPFPMRSAKLFGMETAISFMRLMDRLEFR